MAIRLLYDAIKTAVAVGIPIVVAISRVLVSPTIASASDGCKSLFTVMLRNECKRSTYIGGYAHAPGDSSLDDSMIRT